MPNKFLHIARRCFAVTDDDGFIKQENAQSAENTSQSKQGDQEKKENENSPMLDITPLLDKTQLAHIGEIDWEFPESFYKELKIDNDEDKLLVVDGVQDLVTLWKICSSVATRKDWTINKVDLKLYERLYDEIKVRTKEVLKLLFTLSDNGGHSYIFWLVNPSVIEGQFSCKVQEQTFGTEYTVNNTSVLSIKYKDGDEPGDYAIDPIIDEFAKEDRTVKEEAQSIIESQEVEETEEEDMGEDSWMDEDMFSEEGEEETSEEGGEESEKAEPKNFSYLRHFFEV